MVWIIRLDVHYIFGKYAHSTGIENGDLYLIFMYGLSWIFSLPFFVTTKFFLTLIFFILVFNIMLTLWCSRLKLKD